MFRLHIICLAELVAAGLLHPNRETLLATDLETVNSGASESVRAAEHEELTLLDGEVRQLDSMIVEVMSHLQHAVKTFQSVKNASLNGTKADPAKAAKGTPAKAGAAKASPENLTLAKTAPVTKLVMSKTDINATLHNEQTLLQDLMKHLNNQIKNFNKEDTESKEMAEKMRKKFEEKLKKDEANLQQKGLRDFDHARLVNATRMDKQDLAYWSRDGDLRHKMVHANLQMSSDLMASVKNVLDVYNQAVKKGGVDDGMLKKVQAAAGTKTSFLQLREDLQQRMQKFKAQLRSL